MPIGIYLDCNSNTEDRYTVKLHRHSILTTVTATSTVVDQWISDIYRIYCSHLHHLIVSLNVEWRYPIPTLQLCVGHRCLIFPFYDAEYNPESLVQFLAEPDFTFVGVGIEEDVKTLENCEDLSVGWTSDLRSLAAEELRVSELKQAGLKRLATVVLGANVDNPKRFRMNEWNTDFLVLDQKDRYTVKLHRHSILTTVTANSSVVDQWISDIYRIYRSHLHHLIIGLDTEWRPPYNSPVATLQLCVGHRCLIFQLIHADGIPESLVKFLGEPDFTFVRVGIEEDVKKLENHNQLYLSWTSDLQPLVAKELGASELKRASLTQLAWVVLGIEVNKPKRMRIGPWDMKLLILDQVLYACIDAFLSFEIGRKLVNGNRRFSVKWVDVLVFFLCFSLVSWLWDRLAEMVPSLFSNSGSWLKI